MDDSSKPVAFVTGASRGIGRLIATELAADGATTVGFARASAELESLQALPSPVVPLPMDVTDPKSVSSAFSIAVELAGPPTLLVTCAGSIGGLGPIATVDPERWWNAVAVDLERAVDFIRRIGAGHADELAGRVIHAGDDLESITQVCRSDPDQHFLRLRR